MSTNGFPLGDLFRTSPELVKISTNVSPMGPSFLSSPATGQNFHKWDTYGVHIFVLPAELIKISTNFRAFTGTGKNFHKSVPYGSRFCSFPKTDKNFHKWDISFPAQNFPKGCPMDLCFRTFSGIG